MKANRAKAVAAIRALRGHNVAEFSKSLPAAPKRSGNQAPPSAAARSMTAVDLCDDDEDDEGPRHYN